MICRIVESRKRLLPIKKVNGFRKIISDEFKFISGGRSMKGRHCARTSLERITRKYR